jgi:hypothetical protein
MYISIFKEEEKSTLAKQMYFNDLNNVNIVLPFCSHYNRIHPVLIPPQNKIRLNFAEFGTAQSLLVILLLCFNLGNILVNFSRDTL